MRKFALLAAVCFSLTAMADSLSADSISAQQVTLTASANGGINDLGLFDFAAYGGFDFSGLPYQGTKPTNLSFSWDRSFEIPASPASDFFAVTRVDSYSAGGNIVIDREAYGPQDDLHFSPPPFADPITFPLHGYAAYFTVPMYLTGPISIHVYGSFGRSFNGENCCYVSGTQLNGNTFEQFLQIERFHADGTPDPFAPEPASFGLVGLALLPVGWMLRRRSAAR